MPCPFHTKLQNTLQTKAALDAGQTSSIIYLNTNKVYLDATSNTQVKVYQHSDDSVTCDLSVLGKVSCDVDYWNEVISINGTVVN